MLGAMPRHPYVPSELTHGPFTIADAARAGLDRWHLEASCWKRLGPETYVWRQLPETPLHRIEAAVRRLPAGAAFSGLTAAWLHGLDVEPCDPIEATVAADAGVSGRSGMALRRSILRKEDVVRVRGMPATSIVRTLAEVCCRLSLMEGVVVLDEALHHRRVRVDQLSVWAQHNAGRRGVRNLRRAIELAEPAAESPMESRLRMTIVLGGLPRPKAQVPIHDLRGTFLGRLDLYYEKPRLGIEYDGGHHRETLAEDNRRQNKLLSAGIRLLRFTHFDVLNAPDQLVHQVRAMLNAASAGSRGLQLAG